MKLLIAPAHYILSRNEGSEYTRAFEYIEAVSKHEKITGDVLVGYSSIKKIGNLKIISMLKEKPVYISILLRFRFIFWVFITYLHLKRKIAYNCIWHLGPFSIGETFSLVALFNRKRTRFVIGPVYTPFKKIGKKDFGLFGKKSFGNISTFMKITIRIEHFIYINFSKSFSVLSKLTLKQANSIIAIEETGMNIIKNLGINNVRVITLGINEHDFLFTRKTNKLKIVRLLTVGYLIPRKRIQDIIEAIRLLVQNKFITHIHLTIVGDGSEKESLIKLTRLYHLEKFISFVGLVPKKTMPQYYKRSDISVSASTVESMPGVYFEAMASAMPLVIAENTTSQTFKKQGFGGYVVKGGNPKMMADAIEKLVTNSTSIRKLGQKNLEIYKTYYSFEKNITALIAQFQKSL